MGVSDYIKIAAGILVFAIGIFQLVMKRCPGKHSLDKFTEESARKFALVSGVIYAIGGMAVIVITFLFREAAYEAPVSALVIACVLAVVAEHAILKKKN